MRDSALQARVRALEKEIARLQKAEQTAPWGEPHNSIRRDLGRAQRRLAMLLEHERTEGARHA